MEVLKVETKAACELGIPPEPITRLKLKGYTVKIFNTWVINKDSKDIANIPMGPCPPFGLFSGMDLYLFYGSIFVIYL